MYYACVQADVCNAYDWITDDYTIPPPVCVVCLPFLCIFIQSPRQVICLCCLFTVFVHFHPQPSPGYTSVLFVYRFCAFSSTAHARVYVCVVCLPFLCIFVQSPRQVICLCCLFTVFVHFRPETAPGYMSVLFVSIFTYLLFFWVATS